MSSRSRTITLAFSFLSVLAACTAPVPQSAEVEATAPGAVQGDAWLDGLAAELERARAARTAKEHAQAREIIAGAVDRALAELGEREDARSLGLLADLSNFAFDAGDLPRAEAARLRVFELRKRTLPADHLDLLQAQQALAISISSRGDPRGSLEHFEAVLAGRLRVLPADHRDVLNARKNLAVTLKRVGDLAGARALEEQVLEALLRQMPDDHAEVLKVRHNLATTLYMMGEFEEARDLFQRVLEIRVRTLPDDDAHLQSTRTALAATLSKLGELRAALALQTKVVEVLSASLPDEHPDLLAALGNLALSRRELGDLQGALALEERVLAARERTLSDGDDTLQAACCNLALTLRMTGDLTRARALEEQVLEVCTRTLPDDHPDLQIARQNLALTLKLLGDLGRARVLEERVLEVRASTLPDDHPYLAEARLNLAITLEDLGDAAAARELQEKVLEVYSRTFPADHPNAIKARQNLAATLKELGQFDRARELDQEVVEARSHFLPREHPDMLGARQNLAQSMAATGEIAAAREIEEDVLAIRSRTQPADHPEVELARRELARTILDAITLARAGRADPEATTSTAEDVARLTELLRDLCRAQTGAARKIVLSAPSREAEERCARMSRSLDFALSAALGWGAVEPLRAIQPEVFAFAETARGAALASALQARRAAASPRYGEVREDLRRTSAELAVLAQRGAPDETLDRARESRDAAERTLVELARQLPGGEAASGSFDADALAASLLGGQVAVAFRRFEMSRGEVRGAPSAGGRPSVVETAEARLCAFVVRAASPEDAEHATLELVDLGPIAPIERAVESWRDGLGVSGERGVPASAGVLAENLHARGAAVRRLVLDPLEPALGSARYVVLALDDVLHLVPLDALPAGDEGSELLGDRRRFETRATLAELLSPGAVAADRDVLVAIGGATFDEAPLAPDAEEGDKTATGTAPEASVAARFRGGLFEGRFLPLAETGREARELAALHGEVAGKDAESLAIEGRKASRESLFEHAPRARWLHVATHGWFAADSIRSWSDPEPLDARSGLAVRWSAEERIRGMSPMLLCGLAFSGANLSGDDPGAGSGLVTAEELASLDLSNCELAVLSACDTNVGERRAGQGVASLQKALHMAGARTAITSLWKVPDEATKDLMLDFYRRIWVEKKPKAQALWGAKKKLRDTKDDGGAPKYSTRDWAAWVLTGDPR